MLSPAPGLDDGVEKVAENAPLLDAVTVGGLVLTVPLVYEMVIVAPGVKPEPVTVTGVPMTPDVGLRVMAAWVVLGVMV